MTVKNVGGCLIDFTSSKHPNDQLSAFFPLGKTTNWRSWASEPAVDKSSPRGKAGTVAVVVRATLVEGKLEADTTYVLADGADRLEITTTLRNLTDAPHTYTIVDDTRADGTVFVRGNTGDLQWAYDRWWNAAFGVVADRIDLRGGRFGQKLAVHHRDAPVALAADLFRDLKAVAEIANTAADPNSLLLRTIEDAVVACGRRAGEHALADARLQGLA